MSTGIDWKRARILILNSDDKLRFQLRLMFNRLQPAKLMGAESAADALRLLAQYGAHVVLVDVTGEDCLGIDFLRLLRDDLSSPSPKVPVVLMAHMHDDGSLAKACAYGFEGVARKPVNELTLFATVEEAIRAPCRMTLADFGLDIAPKSQQLFISPPVAVLSEDDLALLALARQRDAVSKFAPAAGHTTSSPPETKSPGTKSSEIRPPGVGGSNPAGTATPGRTVGGALGRGGAVGASVGLAGTVARPGAKSVKPAGVEVAAAPPSAKLAAKPVGVEVATAAKSDKPVAKPVGVEVATAPQPVKPAVVPAVVPVVVEIAVKPQPAKPVAKKPSSDKAALASQDPQGTELARKIAAHQEWVLSRGQSGEKGEFVGARLEDWDLEDAQLSQADLRDSHLENANLGGAQLIGADLRYAELSGASLNGANLSVARLRHADLRLANLEGANLRGADLAGANLTGVRFGDADLAGALLLEARLDDADLRSVAGLTQAQLRKVWSNADTRIPIGLRLPEKT